MVHGNGVELFDLIVEYERPKKETSQQLRLLKNAAEHQLMPIPHLAAYCNNHAVLRWCLANSKASNDKRNRSDSSSLSPTSTAYIFVSEGTVPLHWAVLGQSLECVRLLVEEAQIRPDVAIAPRKPSESKIIITEELKSLGSENSDASHGSAGMTPLHLACQVGSREIFDYLYKQYELLPTTVRGERQRRPLLLPVDQDGCPPLFYAVTGGHSELVRYLITPPATKDNTSDGDPYGDSGGLGMSIALPKARSKRTILQEAMAIGKEDIASMLIEEARRRDKRKLKAFLNQPIPGGAQAIHFAASFDAVECLELLLSLRDEETGIVRARVRRSDV